MAELVMLADIQRTVDPEEVTHQLHVMVEARERSPAKDQCSTHCARPLTSAWVMAHIRSSAFLYINRHL